jgi:taurine transport system substrate-binding protein
VATGMASGDVQIGVIGSSPLTAAVSRGVDLQLFWIIDDINEAEAMVARNGAGITKPTDLRGKKIAVPFVSTTHFHTMFALETWGIKPTEVKLLNMQPNQIAAAWERAISTRPSCRPGLEQAQAKRQGAGDLRRTEQEGQGHV